MLSENFIKYEPILSFRVVSVSLKFRLTMLMKVDPGQSEQCIQVCLKTMTKKKRTKTTKKSIFKLQTQFQHTEDNNTMLPRVF